MAQPQKRVEPAYLDPAYSVDLFDASRKNAFGDMYCVAPAILPEQADWYWEQYLESPEARPVRVWWRGNGAGVFYVSPEDYEAASSRYWQLSIRHDGETIMSHDGREVVELKCFIAARMLGKPVEKYHVVRQRHSGRVRDYRRDNIDICTKVSRRYQLVTVSWGGDES